MTKVELLGSDGWKSAGEYAIDRAKQLAELLRLSGAIVRVEGEQPQRGRIHWKFEPEHGSWLGSLDGIELFVVVMQDASCTLYPALPGYRKAKLCDSAPAAADTAERILDQFIMRMGVRGVSLTTSSTTDTMELDPAMLPPELRHDDPADAVAPDPTLILEEVPDDLGDTDVT